MGTNLIPYLQKNQPIGDWGKEFIGACASANISDENALKVLPQFAARDIGTKEYAYVACENDNDPKDNTVVKALAQLAEFVEGKQTRLKKASRFFDVVLEDLSVEGQTKYFFDLVNTGLDTTALIPSDVIMLRFLQSVPDGVKMFDKSKDKVKAGLNKKQLIDLFQEWTIKESAEPTRAIKLEREDAFLAENSRLYELEQDIAELRSLLDQSNVSDQVSEAGSDDVMFNSKRSDQGIQRQNHVNRPQKVTCSICKKSGHGPETCYKRICKRCDGRGHDVEKCPSFPGARNAGASRSRVSGTVNINSSQFNVDLLLDSGANTSVCSISSFVPSEKGKKSLIKGVGGTVQAGSPVCGIVRFNALHGKEFTCDMKPITLPGEKNLVILGRDFMSKFGNTEFDWDNRRVKLGDDWVFALVKTATDDNSEGGMPEEDPPPIPIPKYDPVSEEFVYVMSDPAKGCKIESSLKKSDREALENLIEEFEDTFANNPKGPNEIKGVEHVIHSRDDRVVRDKVRRINAKDAVHVNNQVNEMLKNNIIRPSKSAYNSNPVLVNKKDGSKRFCIDFRSLNKNTVKDDYPIPRIDDMLDACFGCTIFTQLDLASGYWGIAVREEDREKLAFSVPKGKYEMCRMAFGLFNAGPTFQRNTDQMIKELEDRGVTGVGGYMDNFMISSKSMKEHLETLREVFKVMREYNMSLRRDKCEFAFKSLDFLGYNISAEGVRASKENVEKVQKFPMPTTRKEVQRFLGIANYNRRFVENFSTVVAPLSALTSNKVSFVFGKKEEDAFRAIQKCIYNAPLLHLPDLSLPFHIRTDASGVGIGALLFQVKDKKEDPVAYHSELLHGSERKWCATDQELYAIIRAKKKWRHFFTNKVIFHTDHQPLKTIRSKKDPRGKIARWLLELEGCDYTVEYIKGKENTTADYLSRIAIPDVRKDDAYDEELSVYVLFVDNSAETLSVDKIAEEQQKDEPIGAMIKELKEHGKILTGPLRNYSCMVSEEGLLLKGKRIVVPATMTRRIIQEYHGQHHYGVENTVLLLKTRFYWKNMVKDVDKFIQDCRTCTQCKHGAVPKAKMTLDPERPSVMERVAIDVATMPRTIRDNKYILAIVDCCSGFVAAAVMADQKADTIEKALWQQWFAYFGLPKQLISDQGRNVDGNIINQLCKGLNIKKLRSSPFHPEGNGIAERSIGSLKTVIRAIAQARQVNPAQRWDLLLDEAVLAKNSMGNKSTGSDAFTSVLGKGARMPVDNMLNLNFTGNEVNREALLENTRLNRMESQEASKRIYDKNAKETELKVGDEVLLKRNFGEYPKINVKWNEGPYIISEIISPCSYKIRNSKGKEQVRHHNQLKPALNRQEPVKVPHPLGQIYNRPQFGVMLPYSNSRNSSVPLDTTPLPVSPSVIHRHDAIQPVMSPISTTPASELPTNYTEKILDVSGFNRNVFSTPSSVISPSGLPPAPSDSKQRTSGRVRKAVVGNRLEDQVVAKPLACERL